MYDLVNKPTATVEGRKCIIGANSYEVWLVVEVVGDGCDGVTVVATVVGEWWLVGGGAGVQGMMVMKVSGGWKWHWTRWRC